MTTADDRARLDEIEREYDGCDPSIKLANIRGTLLMREFYDLISLARDGLRWRGAAAAKGEVEATAANAPDERELVELSDTEIVIRVPIAALPNAAAIAWERRSTRDLIVSDLPTFAKEVVRCLRSERENGDTLVTDMLDNAVVQAVESGSEGVELKERLL